MSIQFDVLIETIYIVIIYIDIHQWRSYCYDM